MKKAIILHGTDGNSKENWFPWLKKELEKLGWKVWLPDLPGANEPNFDNYLPFIFENVPFEIDQETIIIGHSSGAVTTLGLLEELKGKVHHAYLVGVFKDDLGWDNLKKLFKTPLNFVEIKKHSMGFTLLHSDNDPYCPLDHAEYIAEMTGGKLVILEGQMHFSANQLPEYTQFPFLLDEIISLE